MVDIGVALRNNKGVYIGPGNTAECMIRNGCMYMGVIRSIELGFVKFENGFMIHVSEIDDIKLLR